MNMILKDNKTPNYDCKKQDSLPTFFKH